MVKSGIEERAFDQCYVTQSSHLSNTETLAWYPLVGTVPEKVEHLTTSVLNAVDWLFPVCPAENAWVVILISVSSDITLSTFDEGKKAQTTVPLHSCSRSVQLWQLSGSVSEKPGSVKLYLNPVFRKSRKYDNLLLLGYLLVTTYMIQGWVRILVRH